jgi:hypothetical protein
MMSSSTSCLTKIAYHRTSSQELIAQVQLLNEQNDSLREANSAADDLHDELGATDESCLSLSLFGVSIVMTLAAQRTN